MTVDTMACMTIAASDPARMIGFIERDLGWPRFGEGPIDAALEQAWGIASGSAGGRYTLLKSPGASRGAIRIVEGQDRWPLRPIGARWTGVEIIVGENLEGLCVRLGASPDFVMGKAPDHADFSDDSEGAHRYFYGRAPAGTHFMFTMFSGTGRDYQRPPAGTAVGYIFSVPLVSRHLPSSHIFYRETLGMQPILEFDLEQGAIHDAWGLPSGTPVHLEILKGDTPGSGLGAVELQAYDLHHVDPIAAIRDRFDGGTCMVTYTTADIDAAYAAVQADPHAVALSAPTVLAPPAYGGGLAFTCLGPSGERLEICQHFAV